MDTLLDILLDIGMFVLGGVMLLLALSILITMAYLQIRFQRTNPQDVEYVNKFGWVTLAFVAFAVATDVHILFADKQALAIDGSLLPVYLLLLAGNLLVLVFGAIWLLKAWFVRKDANELEQYVRKTNDVNVDAGIVL